MSLVQFKHALSVITKKKNMFASRADSICRESEVWINFLYCSEVTCIRWIIEEELYCVLSCDIGEKIY